MGGISLKTGSTIQAAVLDVAKIERLVELSVKPAFVDKLREKTSSMETNKKVGLRFGFYFHFRILFAGCSLAFCPSSSSIIVLSSLSIYFCMWRRFLENMAPSALQLITYAFCWSGTHHSLIVHFLKFV